MPKKPDGALLRIGELARASGVTVSTVKYYIQQGFIEPELKTSANMAYYHPDSISRIQLIKKLQKEFFYPLSIIGEILRGSKSDLEIDLINAVYKVLPPKEGRALTPDSAAKETGLTAAQVEKLAEYGVINPVNVNGKPMLDAYDIEVLRLVKRRCDAGLPFLQTLESLTIYANALDSAVREDVDVMIRRTIMTDSFSLSDIASMAGEADRTLDEFFSLKRAQLDSHYSSRRMHELLEFLNAMNSLAQWLPELEEGAGLGGQVAVWMGKLLKLSREVDVAASGSTISRMCEFFSAMDTETEDEPERRKAVLALRLGFFALAPGMFGWRERANMYTEEFEAECAGFLGREAAAAFGKQVLSKLKELSGKREM